MLGTGIRQIAIHSTWVLLLTACTQKAKQAPWTPLPRVGWEHISTEPIPPIEDGYRILASEPTRGLFPVSVAVSRVALVEGKVNGIEPRLLTDPRNEFLQWNSTFDDLMAVSEVFSIAQRTLGGGVADPQQILAAFRALHARLGLAYAVNELSEHETEILAVLYDLGTQKPLVGYHVRAVSTPPTEEDSKDEPTNLWLSDSRALVRAKFDQMAHASMRELILADQPAGLEDKSGWTPEGPIHPVEWPPRQARKKP